MRFLSGIAAWVALCLVWGTPVVQAQSPTTTQNNDGGVTVEGANEAASELKSILGGGAQKKAPAEERKKQPEASPKNPVMDYDAEIAKAKKAGDYFKAAILQNCKSVPPGSTVTTSPADAAIMRQYCIGRDFDIAVDPAQRIKGPIRTDPPAAAKQEKGNRLDPAVEACRRETLKHVITCAKVTDYLNCETWGCPEVVQCDKRLTRCDDYGSPYNQSGNFYCDTRNWRTRDFDLNVLLEETCPSG